MPITVSTLPFSLPRLLCRHGAGAISDGASYRGNMPAQQTLTRIIALRKLTPRAVPAISLVVKSFPVGTRARAKAPLGHVDMSGTTNRPYLDDTPLFAAGQVPACFTASQVRQSLGQSVAMVLKSKAEEPTVQECGHFLPNCICSPLHVNCGHSPPPEAGWAPINVTLKQLKAASAAGCPFCRSLYGGCIATALWDPSRRVKTPINESLKLSMRPEGLDFGVTMYIRAT